MSGIVSIQFTQDQARTLIGVSTESIRHWRKAIPYLSTKTGKAARFTFSELLGLAITHELVSSFGIHIGRMSDGVDAAFRLLSASGPTVLDGAVLSITSTEATLYETGVDGARPMPFKPSLMIPLAPLIAKIQQHMLPVITLSGQKPLPFPPEAVRNRA